MTCCSFFLLLLFACSDVLAAIHQVVEEDERVAGNGLTEFELAEGFNATDLASEALGKLRAANENKFRGRVQNCVIPREHQVVGGSCVAVLGWGLGTECLQFDLPTGSGGGCRTATPCGGSRW